MVYMKMNGFYLYLALSALLWVPGSYSENSADESDDWESSELPSEQETNMRNMLSSLPEPYNKVTIRQTFDAQVGDECNEEAWKKLTHPFWNQNFNADVSASDDVYIKAHTGWMENPEFAGKSCFNNRHVRSGNNQIFPALPLKCVSGKCTCYKDVLGSRRFKLHQVEIKYQGIGSAPDDELVDCVGDTGSNCNTVLFPCDPKNKCVRQKTGLLFECVAPAPKPVVAVTAAKEGRKVNPSVKKEMRTDKVKPSVKKEMRNDKVIAAVKDIPGILNAACPSVASGITVLFLGLFASRLV